MERKKGLAAGAEQFPSFFARGRELYYVDKSMFIKELIDTGFLEAFPKLILRPRRFGKTLALSMLRTFFDINEKDNAWMFDGLAISGCGELCAEHQNRYPVISVNLKDIEADSFGWVVKKTCMKLSDELTRQGKAFEEILMPGNSGKYGLKKQELSVIRHIWDGEADAEETGLGLKLMTKALYGYYGIKPLVFVDEYDGALNSAYGKGYFPKMLELFSAMFSSGFKGNDCLGGVLITGILQITKSNIFSGMNNLAVNSVADAGNYSDAFGFTQGEVDAMLGYYGINRKKKALRDWYDGYHIGKSCVYNPYSLASAVSALLADSRARLRNYWLNTAGNGLLKEMLASAKEDEELKDMFDVLIGGGSVSAGYTTEVIYPEILDSRETITGTLLLSGYLTMDRALKLKIPNQEVMTCFNSLAEDYNSEYDEALLPGIIKAYVDGKPDDAGSLLTEYFRSILSPRDLIKSELVYHGFLCGALAVIKALMRKSLGDWELESNYQEELGYPDLVFWNLAERRAVIIEEKAVKASAGNPLELIEKSRDEGFAQIQRTGYNCIEGFSVTCFVNVYYRHKAYVYMST